MVTRIFGKFLPPFWDPSPETKTAYCTRSKTFLVQQVSAYLNLYFRNQIPRLVPYIYTLTSTVWTVESRIALGSKRSEKSTIKVPLWSVISRRRTPASFQIRFTIELVAVCPSGGIGIADITFLNNPNYGNLLYERLTIVFIRINMPFWSIVAA